MSCYIYWCDREIFQVWYWNNWLSRQILRHKTGFLTHLIDKCCQHKGRKIETIQSCDKDCSISCQWSHMNVLLQAVQGKVNQKQVTRYTWEIVVASQAMLLGSKATHRGDRPVARCGRWEDTCQEGSANFKDGMLVWVPAHMLVGGLHIGLPLAMHHNFQAHPYGSHSTCERLWLPLKPCCSSEWPSTTVMGH